jgi:uncharacterized protein (DUF488 family)
MSQLFTLGYEGASINDFIASLKRADISRVVDVREMPLSRKPGFSKTAFAAALAASSIEYLHYVTLGCPKPVRDQYRLDGDWGKYSEAFKKYLSTQRQVIRELAEIAQNQKSCLVCFEADFNFCHRSMIAEAVHKIGGPAPEHLIATARKVVRAPARRAA